MKTTNLSRYALSLCLPLLINAASAAVDAAQADRLGNSLTPVGAERAGNAAGTIPEWTGGLPRDAGKVTDGFREDPFAGETPLFTITAQNLEQYRKQLSPGQQALFARYPGTYKMPVYPSHRSVAWPQKAYEVARKNALATQAVESGNGLEHYASPLAFPIPQNGLEVLWNHITRYRGGSFTRETTAFMTTPTGDYSWKTERDRLAYSEELLDYDPDKSKNILYYFTSENIAPARDVGGVLLVHETLNQVKEPRMAWQYNAGQRRVRRAPQVAYDSPGPGNLRTTDQTDMFNGSPDRYDWQLIGKREMYVPYNSFRLAAPGNSYDELITPGHLNQDKTRYELHRVWEVIGTLKAGQRHVYAKRHLFIDEDSWTIVEADHYDSRGNLWRVSENHLLPLYDVQTQISAGELTYDLISGRYLANYMFNKVKNAYRFGLKSKTSDFTPAALRTIGIR
ncbi:DUF1329 domain-containing protein [Phytopseudomonas dryadis]|uniref:DUF1329 domain-containing protein n=1 Tax=Phytopseudomonas dryadis TaxID=2487520 RepID=A0A4Q9R807_9GAMM|nr:MULTISPECIES: DUF1329 domain-containing protein [Pseudomonas]TBU96758.1 DUF1329 domain-containing protein [Pseudomonas dryadis]TBV00287.1 DUF1329 domain-containing protein [Pseudomonas dryadis]TBV12828.1 DUF1329 domain-containing protein [Pseudomonas sp. FRB 230]